MNKLLCAAILLALLGFGMLIAKGIRYAEADDACNHSGGVLVVAPNDRFVCIKPEAVQK